MITDTPALVRARNRRAALGDKLWRAAYNFEMATWNLSPKREALGATYREVLAEAQKKLKLNDIDAVILDAQDRVRTVRMAR